MEKARYGMTESKKFSDRRKEINNLSDEECKERYDSICKKLRESDYAYALKFIRITDGVNH